MPIERKCRQNKVRGLSRVWRVFTQMKSDWAGDSPKNREAWWLPKLNIRAWKWEPGLKTVDGSY